MKYAVTGSTGAFGSLAIRHLLSLKVPASSIVALARDESKAAGLKALGVQVRIADYGDRRSLDTALVGVDRLLLVSGSEVGKRAAQHQAVIDAAKADGVKLVVYTSLGHADTSPNPLASEHKATERALAASGLPFVILRNNWYSENYADDLRRAKESGTIAAAVGQGRVASASRSDYAEAAARVLAGEGHAGKTYELTGTKAWDYRELAATAAEILGRSVSFTNMTAEERRKSLLSAGLPEGAAAFVASLDQAIEAGSLAAVSGDLEKLLGRKPQSLKDGLRAALGYI
jgi:NAD(P)H dehydrogenase (quinone)